MKVKVKNRNIFLAYVFVFIVFIIFAAGSIIWNARISASYGRVSGLSELYEKYNSALKYSQRSQESYVKLCFFYKQQSYKDSVEYLTTVIEILQDEKLIQQEAIGDRIAPISEGIIQFCGSIQSTLYVLNQQQTGDPTLSGKNIFYQKDILDLYDRIFTDLNFMVEHVASLSTNTNTQFVLMSKVFNSAILIGGFLLAFSLIPFIFAISKGLFIPRSSINTILLTDPDTDIYNRQYFINFVTKYKNLSDRYGNTFGVIMLRLNNPEQFMRKNGKRALSVLMRAYSDVIRSSLRSYDIAARYDEYVLCIVLPENKPESIFMIADRLKDKTAETRGFIGKKATVQSGVTAVAAEYRNYADMIEGIQAMDFIGAIYDILIQTCSDDPGTLVKLKISDS